MEIAAKLRTLAKKVEGLKGDINTEEDTKNSLCSSIY